MKYTSDVEREITTNTLGKLHKIDSLIMHEDKLTQIHADSQACTEQDTQHYPQTPEIIIPAKLSRDISALSCRSISNSLNNEDPTNKFILSRGEQRNSLRSMFYPTLFRRNISDSSDKYSSNSFPVQSKEDMAFIGDDQSLYNLIDQMKVLETEIDGLNEISGIRKRKVEGGDSDRSLNLEKLEDELRKADVDFEQSTTTTNKLQDTTRYHFDPGEDLDDNLRFLRNNNNATDTFQDQLDRLFILEDEDIGTKNEVQPSNNYIEEEEHLQPSDDQYGGEKTVETYQNGLKESFREERCNTQPLLRCNLSRKTSKPLTILSRISEESLRTSGSDSIDLKSSSMISCKLLDSNESNNSTIEEKLKQTNVSQTLLNEIRNILKENNFLREKMKELLQKNQDEKDDQLVKSHNEEKEEVNQFIILRTRIWMLKTISMMLLPSFYWLFYIYTTSEKILEKETYDDIF